MSVEIVYRLQEGVRGIRYLVPVPWPSCDTFACAILQPVSALDVHSMSKKDSS